MVGLGGLEPRPRLYQSSLIWFYNNLQDRGDCQSTRKAHKIVHVVGWIVGRTISGNALKLVATLHINDRRDAVFAFSPERRFGKPLRSVSTCHKAKKSSNLARRHSDERENTLGKGLSGKSSRVGQLVPIAWNTIEGVIAVVAGGLALSISLVNFPCEPSRIESDWVSFAACLRQEDGDSHCHSACLQ